MPSGDADERAVESGEGGDRAGSDRSSPSRPDGESPPPGPGSPGSPSGPGGPDRTGGGGDDRPGSPREWVRWFRTTDSAGVAAVREFLSSALLVVLVAGVLFGISGIWPPMVAVKSESMEPHMYRGDLVFVAEEHRFANGNAVADTGVVTREAAVEVGYRKFGGHGDVIIYRPNGDPRTDPIIHRAMFYVEEGENWYPRANDSYVRAENCAQLRNCPAPNAGFITKGDNPETNAYYDQARGMSRPVQPEWVRAKALVRVPGLGLIRLKWAELKRAAASAAAAALLVGGTRPLRA